jgi:3D (Asp-Asp-Asp) domain-containing protein
MKLSRSDLTQTGIAVIVAAAFILTGVTRLPENPPQPLSHPPVLIYSEPMLDPLIVRAAKPPKPNPFARAPVGERIPVSLTQYCLKGFTRRDNYVREGIVAADPRVFPLARYVEIFVGKKYLGRFLVDDTGGKVKGRILDIWTPSCEDAKRFGRRKGTAILLAKGDTSKRIHTDSLNTRAD